MKRKKINERRLWSIENSSDYGQTHIDNLNKLLCVAHIATVQYRPLKGARSNSGPALASLFAEQCRLDVRMLRESAGGKTREPYASLGPRAQVVARRNISTTLAPWRTTYAALDAASRFPNRPQKTRPP
ncbi:unnamed protein product [Colias eurytheme]|nr:unnamed protein product [Colias eurytheme]